MSLCFIFEFILIFIFKSVSVVHCDGKIVIDIDHLNQEPDCGKLPTIASSRISNAQDSEQHYPWVVQVDRSNEHLEGKGMLCGGSIITKNSVVTAAHCVCGPISENDYTVEKHVRNKIACKGGKTFFRPSLLKPKFHKKPPNEVTDDNKIQVGAGDKNHRNLQDFEILYAYVHNEYMDKFVDRDSSTIDIALLKTWTSRRLPKGKNLYDNLGNDFKIGPICIVAESVEDTDLLNGKFETVGWGVIYEEEHEETTTSSTTTSTSIEPSTSSPPMETADSPTDPEDPVANKHSCTTNKDGPIDQAFRHCDVQFLKTQDWTCDLKYKQLHVELKENLHLYLTSKLNMVEKEARKYTENIRIDKEGTTHYYPAGYDAYGCIELWNEADKAIRIRTSRFDLHEMLEIWKTTNQIEIGKTKQFGRSAKRMFFGHMNLKKDFDTIKTCFKDELFQTHGWCFTEGEILTKGWGFCDSSCKLMRYREDPEILSLKYTPDIYQKMTWQIDSMKSHDQCLEKNYPQWLAPWHLCTQSTILPSNIAYFTENDDRTLRFVGNLQREQPDYPNHVEWGTQQMCKGDSGGGHWTFGTKEKRATLIGVTTLGSNWCGAPSVIDKLTYNSINNWIKFHANIRPQASSGSST